MMRILAISNYLPPFEIGGWDQLTHDVCRGLIGRGHEVHVLASNYRAGDLDQPEANITRSLHLESPDHVRYQLSYTVNRRRWERRNGQIIARTITGFEPDLVFVNGMWNLPVSVAAEAEKRCPGRVVYYMASYWPAEEDAHTAYWRHPDVRPGRWLPKRMLGALARAFFLNTGPRNQLAFARVLCVSEFLRQQLVESAQIPFEQTFVVHNGIEQDAFVARSTAAGQGPMRLIYAGRLSADKGVHTLVEGLAQLRQNQPPFPVELSIYGGGAPHYEDQLRHLAFQLDVADLVHFRGVVAREQMPQVLAAHDVLVFPSIWPEPLARIVQEAMACGLPVIGTPTGGTPEILKDEENGLTFPAEDASVLANQIARLAGDLTLRNRLARSARRTVEERFTLDRMIDELEAHFRTVLDKLPEVTAV